MICHGTRCAIQPSVRGLVALEMRGKLVGTMGYLQRKATSQHVGSMAERRSRPIAYRLFDSGT